jgi:glutamyl-tRNA synthetase
MIAAFDVADVNVAASRFDPDKLRWINQQYLMKADPAALAPLLVEHLRVLGLDPADGPAPEEVVLALRERAQTLVEMAAKARPWYGELDGFDEASAGKHLVPAAAAPLRAARERLAALPHWRLADVNEALAGAAAEIGLGLGKVAQPLRVAITGSAASPSIDVTVHLAGQARALARIDAALEHIGG